MRGVRKQGKYWIANYQNKAKGVVFQKYLSTEQEAIKLRKNWEKEYGQVNLGSPGIRKDYRGKKIGNFLIIDYVPENHERALVKNLITNEFQERNLRNVTSGQSTGIPKSIASRESKRHEGVGTSFNKACNKWRAYIQINGKRKYLGYFLTQEEAIAARKTAEQKHFN
ncbi:hypothetical protein DQM20_13215 [Lactiplantibacillus plantarum]|uniref:hypothetical protein n=1 Tax=Lactiplantibacillus plantarum TaxID=1590 RepID=UPI000E0930B2|nr:hypothetical protein [Lactiplantibacillus plantarum]RDG25385.1 hypothetical protein DQM20_13215 [Lactiplantibacillus plantarum]